MNQLNAIGNIGKDAEIKYLPKGDAVATFSFALTSGYGDRQVTTWLNCSIFGKRAETLAPMLTKGTKVGVTGELTNRKWQDKEGNDRFSLELRVNDVTLIGGKQDGGKESSSAPAADDDFDQSIPF